uniref:Uncharacterized protein n=1 Tax=Solanum tuberosum TaxID=4113 RepID=M1DB81_SOLTU
MEIEVQCKRKDRYIPPHERRRPKDDEGRRVEEMKENVESCQHIAEEVGEPDLDRHWTQDNFKLESVKLGEPRSNLANRRPGRRSRSNPPLNSARSWVESRHARSFGKLGRAHRTTRQFAEVPPHLALNFMLNVLLGSVTFGEKPEVAKGTRRFAERLFDRLLSAPLNPFCIVTFGGLTLAHRKLSAIRQ